MSLKILVYVESGVLGLQKTLKNIHKLAQQCPGPWQTLRPTIEVLDDASLPLDADRIELIVKKENYLGYAKISIRRKAIKQGFVRFLERIQDNKPSPVLFMYAGCEVFEFHSFIRLIKDISESKVFSLTFPQFMECENGSRLSTWKEGCLQTRRSILTIRGLPYPFVFLISGFGSSLIPKNLEWTGFVSFASGHGAGCIFRDDFRVTILSSIARDFFGSGDLLKKLKKYFFGNTNID